MNTRTTMPAQKLNLKVVEEVDFYRSQTSNDASGWFGPAEVTDVSRAIRGVITVKWQSCTMDIQLPNVRRHLHFLALLTAQEDVELAFPTVYGNVWSAIRSTADKLAAGSLVQVGFHRPMDQCLRQFSLPGALQRREVLRGESPSAHRSCSSQTRTRST